MELLTIIIVIVLAVVALKLLSLLFSGLGKILLIVLAVIIVYAVVAHASRSLVFDDYVFPDQSITIDETAFIVQFDGTQHPSSIQVRYQQNYFFVPRGTCKTITNLDFCFGNSIYDTRFGKIKVNLSVYQVEPEITISRAIDSPRMIVGEEAELSVNVSNGIGIYADRVEFIDTFSPDEFELLWVGGDCSKEGNSAVYRGIIRENKKIGCKYDIKALKELERELKAKVTYFNGVEMKSLFSSAISFDVDPAFSIITEFNDSDSKVFEGADVLFKINLTNNFEDEMDAIVNISLPSGLLYDGTTSFEEYFNETSNQTVRSQKIRQVSDGIFRFDSSFARESSKFIAMKLKAARGGISDIFVSSEYEINGNSYFTEEKDVLNVEHREIVLFANFEDSEHFDSGQEKFFKIGVSNPAESVELRNINVSVSTNLSSIPGAEIEKLEPLEAVFAINREVEMPYVAADTVFPFNIVVSYDTEFGERYDEEFEFDIVVDNIAGLSISHDISKTSVESGEEFTVRAVVRNERNEDIKNVRVFDVVPMEFQRKGLNSVSSLNINRDDEVTAYEYRMVAPEVETPASYSFRTTARYEENNKTYAFERAYQISVNPKRLDLSVTRVLSDTSPFKGAIIDVLYTIANPDSDETLKKITVIFPLQQDIDLIGDTNFTIDQLLPGEKYTIRDVHRIRPKLNGSLTAAPTIFIYSDSIGNVFVKNSSSTSFEAEDGYISGPAFIVEKESSETVFAGDSITVNISASNVGSEAGKIKINDSGNSWALELEPGETGLITYHLKAEKEGIVNFQPSIGSYFYRGRPVYTISNAVYTNVTAKKGAIEEKVAVEEKAEVKEVEITKAEKAPEKMTFLGKVWEAMKMVIEIFGGN